MARTRANEREFQGQVITWIKKQISHGGLPFENATNDSSLYGLQTVRFPDVLVTLDFACERPYCGWELKTPETDVRDKKLLKDAVEKAQNLQAKYFVTWNMRTAIIWRTPAKTRTIVKETDKLREFGPEPRIQSVDDIRDNEKALLMENLCTQLLRDLARLYEDENINLPIADTTVFVGLVGSASNQIVGTILSDINKARANKDFDKRLRAWAVKQGISKYDQEYYQTLAQQVSYKIIGKIMFYMTLCRYRTELPRMELPPKSYKAAMYKMKSLFQQALEVDYQAIFETDIIDEIELSSDTAKIIIQLTENLAHWSFDLMPLDVIGAVFEKLIPEDARHSLGQYFTPSNLVDLIISFCIRSGDDYVMDPTCGTGTFLIRSYHKLRDLKRKRHHRLLEQVWGFDIAGFPSELATINLFRQDFSDFSNFPRVLSRDFFDVKPGQNFEFPPPKRTIKSGERISVEIPKFDALVGNFPFIRQELIERAEKGYKEKLEKVLVDGWGKNYTELFNRNGELRLSGQADIYAYLFFHTAAHLKVGGRMGFVTSNSWLDVAYGYELQRFFLSKFKIIAICESRCEPWFEQSAVNTVFTIIERCDDEEKKNNLVRFVKIKKPLVELFPEDALTSSQDRWLRIERFVDKIEGIAASGKIWDNSACMKFMKINEEYIQQPEVISYEDKEIRMRMIRQEDIKEEVEHTGQTVKWGKYLRAPDIYFELLEKCADKLEPLAGLADIRRGITTGINEFFYLTDERIKHWGIEKEFVKPAIKSPKECGKIKLKRNDLKLSAFLCHKEKTKLKGTKAIKYIKWGETQKTGYGRTWPKVESVRGRKNWYELPKRTPSKVLLPMITGSSLRCILNPFKAQVDHNLFEVVSEDDMVLDGLGIYLNSTVSFLQRELIGRANLGDGALKVEGIDWKRILVPNKETLFKLKENAKEIFEKLCVRDIKNIKKEAKRKDRLEFEKKILISLGLSKELASEIMSAVVELVEERHLLPKLRSSKKKKRIEHDLERLRDEISEEILPDGPIKFPEGFVKDKYWTEHTIIGVPRGKLRIGEWFFDTYEICDSDGQHLIEVSSEEKAKFIVYAKKEGELIIKMPENIVAIKKAVQEYEMYLREIKDKLYTAIMEKCGDHSISDNITRQVFEDFSLPDI